MPDGTGTSPQGGAAAEEATANDAAADGDTKTPRIVEDSKLPNATESPPPGEVITSRLPPEQLSLLLQVCLLSVYSAIVILSVCLPCPRGTGNTMIPTNASTCQTLHLRMELTDSSS